LSKQTHVDLKHEALGQQDTFLETFMRLRNDPELYHSACLKIRDKDGELIPLRWNHAQRLVHDRLEEQRRRTGRVRAVILKARQEGVSTYVAGRFFQRLSMYDGVRGLVIADEIPRAEVIFSYYERMYDHLPREIQPAIKARGNRKMLQYDHDSEIAIRPASDENAGRAQTLHLMHASEIAFWPESTQRQIWSSALSAVPERNSEVIVESTARGAGGLFFEKWEDAQDPRSGWIGIFLPWWIHEEYTTEHRWVEDMRQEEVDPIAATPDAFEKLALTKGIPWEGKNWILGLDRLVWRRRMIVERFGGDPDTLGEDATREFQVEFPATAEEAFVASGAMYFDEMRVRELAQQTEDPILIGKMVEGFTTVTDSQGGTSQVRTVTFQESSRGFVRVYEKPQEQPRDKDKTPKDFVQRHYAIGADTAEGKLVVKSESADRSNKRDDRDYSAGVVITVPVHGLPPKMVALVHGWIPGDIFAKQLALLGEWYSCGGKHDRPPTSREKARLGVENNHSSGQRVLNYLDEIIKYGSRLYWQRKFNHRTKEFEKWLGWRTDEKSRDHLLDTLGEYIRKSGIIVPDARTVRELGQFVYGKDGKPGAMEGGHDDCVFGLALALQMALKEHRHSVLETIPSIEQIEAMTGGI
jgi:hypothetical protein